MTIHDLDTIRGAGGGGKKGGGGGSSADNTLRSKTRARFIELISEGPIIGLKNGAKSIYFDQTRLQNPGGTYNFDNVIWQQHRGNPDEDVFKGQAGVETPTDINVIVKKDTGPVIRSVVDENVDALRVIMRVNSLYRVKDGKMKTNSVEYKIEVRGSGSSWVEVAHNTLEKEKCTSPVQFAHRFDLPGEAPWDVRVTRVTDDSDDDEKQSDIYLDAIVEIVEGKFTYPNSAAIAMEVNAEDMGSSIPPRSYHVLGLKVLVPGNYDPEARTYEGVWNGRFKLAWTNNPAWIFYDLLVNDRYGLGEFIDASIVDKWSLYTIAQYCDQKIPSGFRNEDGDMLKEPRFTYNGVIRNRDEAYAVLQQITSAWRGMAYWSLGQVFATGDMPADPIQLVAPANVIGGEFKYSSTATKARHSVVMVKWNDPDDFYRSATEVVINEQALAEYGWREKTVALNGCTSRGLAHRYGKWMLDIEHNETETIEYQASWDHNEVRPGHIISVADPRKAGLRAGGRIVSHSDTNLITLDAPFKPKSGETYTLLLTMPDGTIEDQRITAFISDTSVRAAGFSRLASPNAMFIIKGTDVVPRQYRVITVDEAEENIFTITGLFHDPQKYQRIERGIVFEPLPYSRTPTRSEPPTNLTVTETSFVENGKEKSRLTVSWSPPKGIVVRNYIVTADTPDDANASIGQTNQFAIDLDSQGEGAYRFYVRTVDFAGRISRPATVDFGAVGGKAYKKGQVTDLRLAEGGAVFAGKDVRLQWKNTFPTSTRANATMSEKSPLYDFNTLRIYRASGQLLRVQRIEGNSFTYSFLANQKDTQALGLPGASRALRFVLTATDVYSKETDPVELSVSNPVPAAFNPSYSVAFTTIYLDWNAGQDDDFAGTMIWISSVSGHDPYKTAPAYDGKGSQFVFSGDEETVYYVRAAAYDSFGKVDLNISPELAIRTRAFFDDEPPAIPTGLAVASKIQDDGKALITATWNANSEKDFAYYDVLIKQGTGNFVSFQTSTNRYEWSAFPGETYTIKVRAADRVYNTSGFTAEVAHTAVKDTTPPAVPAGLTVAGTFEATILKWTANSEKDLAFYEVYESKSNIAPAANTVATFRSITEDVTRSKLSVGTTYHYWIRAVDTSGNRSAWSARVQASTLTLAGTQPAPAIPAAPTVTSSVEVQPGGGSMARVRVTIAAVADAVGYELSITRSGAAEVIVASADLTYDFLAFPNVDHTIRARSIGVLGTKSDFGNSVVHKTARDTVAPGAATITKLTAGIDTMWMTFSAVTDADFAYYEVLENTVDNSGTATVVGKALSDSFSRSGLPNSAARFYWVRSVDTSGNKSALSASVTATTGALPTLDKLTPAGLLFMPDPSQNALSWTAGSMAYGQPGTVPTTKAIAAGSIRYADFNASVYVYYAKGAGVLSATASPTVLYASADNYLLGIYKGGSDFQLGDGKAIVDGANILAATIGAQQLVTNSAVITGTAQIGTAVITTAHIKELSAAALTAGTALAGSITVAGTALSTVNSNAALGAQDPATRINGGSTQVDPGKIVISGASTLADWRGLSDTTTINGGKIETASISTRSIAVGNFQNMFQDEMFTNMKVWQIFGTATFTPYSGPEGSGIRIVKDSATGESSIRPIGYGSTDPKDYVSVVPGDKLRIKLKITRKGGAIGGNIGLYGNYLSNDNQSIGVTLGSTANAATAIGTTVQVSVVFTVPDGAKAIQFRPYYGSNANSANGDVVITDISVTRMNTGEMTVAGTITAEHVNVDDLVVNGLANINTAYIKEANITGTLSAAKITTGTVLAAGVLIGGNSGQTLGDVQAWATNPAARVNAAGTKIDPGLITISGATTLANWRAGGDTTKIEGGALYANSVATNSLKVGARGVTISGVDFKVENGQMSWTSGSVAYLDDDGTITTVGISARTISYDGWTGVYFQKDTAQLLIRNDSNGGWRALMSNSNCVHLCTWWGGTSFAATYGGTIIDGSRIVAQSIVTQQLSAASIKVDQLEVGAVTYDKLGLRAGGYVKIVETTGQTFDIATAFKQRLTIDITKQSNDSLIITSTFRARCTTLGGATWATVQFRLKEYLNGTYQGDVEYNKVFFNDTSSAADDVMTCMLQYIKNGGSGNYTYALEIKKNTSGSDFVIGATKLAAIVGSKQA